MPRFRVLTVVFLILFVLAVRQTWPQGTQMLRRILLPGEATVTEEAFTGMMTGIREGEPVADAVTAFCRQIIEYGIQEAS